VLGLEQLTIFSPSSFRVRNALTESIFSDVTWWRKRGPAPLLMGSNPEKNKHYLIIFSSIHILIHQIYIWYMSMTMVFFDMCFSKYNNSVHFDPFWSMVILFFFGTSMLTRCRSIEVDVWSWRGAYAHFQTHRAVCHLGWSTQILMMFVTSPTLFVSFSSTSMVEYAYMI
jgi:hypothetical protein